MGLGRLALRPLLAGAVGKDFADYGRSLLSYGVDLELVRVSEALDTARAVEIRDAGDGRLRLSYDGAQTESRHITLLPAARRIGGLGLVVVTAGDVEAMVRHTEECRRLGIPFAADPGDRLSRLTGRQARQLVDGARYAFTDEFDVPLLRELTGWGEAELLGRVGTWASHVGCAGWPSRGAGAPRPVSRRCARRGRAIRRGPPRRSAPVFWRVPSGAGAPSARRSSGAPWRRPLSSRPTPRATRWSGTGWRPASGAPTARTPRIK